MTPTRIVRCHRIVTLFLTGALMLAACGDGVAVETGQDPAADAATTPEEDLAFTIDHLLHRGDNFEHAAVAPSRLIDYLPNTLKVIDGRYEEAEELYQGGTAIVIGEITDITFARAYIETEDENLEFQQTDVATDDPTATSQTMHITIRIDEAFADGPEGPTVVAGLTVTNSIAHRIRNGLLQLGPAVFVIMETTTPSSQYPAGINGFGGNGETVGLIAADGSITWPMLDATRAAAKLDGAATLDELRQRATEPPRYIEFTTNERGGIDRVTPPTIPVPPDYTPRDAPPEELPT